MRSTMLDIDSRLRVATAVEQNETLASQRVFEILKRRGHPDAPPPTITDGWGGIDDAMLNVYGQVPEYGGRGRPPTLKQPGNGWLYLQMVKQHDEQGHFTGTKLKAIYGELTELIMLLGASTAYIERDNLTSRMFNARQHRKTLAFSKKLENHRASAVWEDGCRACRDTATTIWSNFTKVCAYPSKIFPITNGNNTHLCWPLI